MPKQRQDQASCSLAVDGRDVPIVFSKRDGGMADSEEVKYPPGGMHPEEALGGRPTVENVTLTGGYDAEAHASIVSWLESRAGRGKAAVSEQPLDREGNAFGAPKTWTGIVKSVHSGDYDSTSNDPRELEIEVSTDGVIA